MVLESNSKVSYDNYDVASLFTQAITDYQSTHPEAVQYIYSTQGHNPENPASFKIRMPDGQNFKIILSVESFDKSITRT